MHQHDISARKRNIGARANGNAHIRAGQCRGVVDAVAHHSNGSLRRKLTHNALFFGGQHAGNNLVGAHLALHRKSGSLGIAREHHRANAHRPQLCNSGSAGCLRHISHRNNAHQLAIASEIGNGFAFVSESFSLRSVHRNAALGHHARIARMARRTRNAGRNALTRNLLESRNQLGRLFYRISSDAACCIQHHRARQRMLGRLFERIGKPQQFFGPHALCRQNVSHLRGTLGDGARFIQHHRLHAARRFQRLGRLHQNAVRGTAARAHHDGSRRCQPQCTGARNYQHGNRVGKRHGKLRPHGEPHREHHHRDGDNHGHEHAADFVGHLFDGRFGTGSFIDQANDAREHGFLAHAFGTHRKPARRVHGGARHRAASMHTLRQRLARNNGFVDRAFTFQHHAVNRHRFARAHHEHVPSTHACGRNLHFNAVFNTRGHFGRKIHELRKRAGGFALRARFQVLAQSDERQDHGRRFEVKVHGEMMSGPHIGMPHKKCYVEQRIYAVDRSGARTQGNERIHVRGAVH